MMMKQVYEENVSLVHYVVRKFGLRDEETEEIVQDAFLRLFENESRVDPAKMRAFLLTTARNLSIDMLRKRKRQKVSFAEDSEVLNETDETLWKNDPRRIVEAQLVGKFLDSIKGEPGGEVLVLFYQEGLTVKQIAERSGESINTVTSKLSRARTKFREKLQNTLDQNWQLEH